MGGRYRQQPVAAVVRAAARSGDSQDHQLVAPLSGRHQGRPGRRLRRLSIGRSNRRTNPTVRASTRRSGDLDGAGQRVPAAVHQSTSGVLGSKPAAAHAERHPASPTPARASIWRCCWRHAWSTSTSIPVVLLLIGSCLRRLLAIARRRTTPSSRSCTIPAEVPPIGQRRRATRRRSLRRSLRLAPDPPALRRDHGVRHLRRSRDARSDVSDLGQQLCRGDGGRTRQHAQPARVRQPARHSARAIGDAPGDAACRSSTTDERRPCRHHVTDDPSRFLSHVEACRREEDLFKGCLARRRPEERTDRRPAAAAAPRRQQLDSAIKTVSLVEENGTLYWRDGIPAASPERRRRRGRRGLDADSEGSLVLTREFQTLAPNKIIAAVGEIDRRLNQAIDESLRSRLTGAADRRPAGIVRAAGRRRLGTIYRPDAAVRARHVLERRQHAVGVHRRQMAAASGSSNARPGREEVRSRRCSSIIRRCR